MKGVVAAGHPLTAEAGARALREGGNAFDAAVSAVLASFAAESPLTGLGAGGFMLAHVEGEGDHLLDFFVEAGGRGLEPDAPRRAGRGSRCCSTRRRRCSTSARRRAGCPGTAAGLWEAARRWCTMPFGELVEPAVRHAREGVRVTPEQAYVFTILEPILTRYPETRALYAPEGRMLTAGDLFRFPTSPTRSSGWRPRARDGCTAARSASGSATGCASAAGCCRPRDFAAYEVIERQPVAAAYRGRDVLTNAPPSSGGILIAFALDLLERLGDTGAVRRPRRARSCSPR